MKKVLVCLSMVLALLFIGCAEKVTDVTVKGAYAQILVEYNFAEKAKNSVENEDGSITYSFSDSNIAAIKEVAMQNLNTKIDGFVSVLKELDSEMIAELSFSDDGTVLEALVSDGAGAQNGLVYLIVPSYPDIVALQLLSGIEPVEITFNITDAETDEFFEAVIPF